ncbi:MAG: hypothetical protein J6U17_00335 [Kiritimatiellae bacterium]|nr:hypothetical protein [Kiritimatiellia bacterium]
MATDAFRAVRAALALAALAFAGCISEETLAAKSVESLRLGNPAPAIEWGGDLATNSIYSSARGRVELARAHMIAGDMPESARWYRAAVDTAIDRKESQPKIKLGDVGNDVLASTITDDRTRQYRLAPYELNLALEHGIVAQELAGMHDDALVDCRLAAYVQDSLADTYGADVAKAAATTNSTARSICAKEGAALDGMIAATRNSWENPVLWWLTGVLFEADADMDAAAQSYRRAAAIRPECAVFAADSARADGPRTPAPDKAKLVVVVGEGFVSRRVALKVPIPIYTGLSFDMPMYQDATYSPGAVKVTVGGRPPSYASPALNIQSLAARDLKEHMPGVVVRNLTRAAVQAGAQAAVNHAGNGYAQAAVLVGNLVVSAIRSADLRSWVTLPMGEHVWCDPEIEPGVHRVEASIGLHTAATTVELKPGETRIVYLNIMK